MKVMTWNINQQSGRRDQIPDFVIDEVMKADMAIITEFKKPQEKLDEFEKKLEEYWLCYSLATHHKEILIAVKKKLTAEPIIEEWEKEAGEKPNFLQIYITVNKVSLRIIGTRIRIGNGSRIDYIERKQQLDNLICELNKASNERLLIGGDFNNSIIRGARDKTYYEVRQEYHYTEKGELSALYDTYNHHILKDGLLAAGLILHTPERNQSSWGYTLLNGNTDDRDVGCIKNDHFATTETIKLSNVEYNIDFITPANGYVKPNIYPPYPDHAILTADLEL